MVGGSPASSITKTGRHDIDEILLKVALNTKIKTEPNRWSLCDGYCARLSVVDHGFELRSGETKDYKIGICCFPTKHVTLRRKSKDWLAKNQDNVSEWGNMFIHGPELSKIVGPVGQNIY